MGPMTSAGPQLPPALAAPPEAAAWETVASLSDLLASPQRRALARLASGRGVAVFLREEKEEEEEGGGGGAGAPAGGGAAARRLRAYALDHACYHHGGPLVDGDIEDVPGVGDCVLCPWHRYRISLSSGEGFYVGVTMPAPGAPAGPPREELRSKGLKQRAHPCRIVAAGAAAGFSGLDEEGPAGAEGAEVQVLDMGRLQGEAEAEALGGATALRMFREQRGLSGAAAAAQAHALSGAGAGSVAAPPSASMAAAVRAQAVSSLQTSDGYARTPFNACTVSCRGEAGGSDGGFGLSRAGSGGGGGGATLPLHSSARDSR